MSLTISITNFNHFYDEFVIDGQVQVLYIPVPEQTLIKHYQILRYTIPVLNIFLKNLIIKLSNFTAPRPRCTYFSRSKFFA
jgi:hypothetical protein